MDGLPKRNKKTHPRGILMAKQKNETTGTDILKKTWKIISIGISTIMILIFAMFFLSIMSAFVPAIQTGNVAIIPIEGLIATNGDNFMPAIKSQSIVELIEKADENEDIKAIILEINSPGGTPVATDEIATAVKETNKTTIAVIRESGASGAYWIATATDKIYANKMSITGSIGVQASRLEFSGLLADYNVTYRRLTAGRLKDAGNIFREMTTEEQQLFQTMLNSLHDEFITTVAQNRNLPETTVRELATGFVYLGKDAKELGLVDEIGGRKDALKFIEKEFNITAEPVEYREHKTFFDEIAGLTNNGFYNVGKGIGETQISFT